MTLPADVSDDAAFCAVYAAQYASLVQLAFVTTGGLPAAEDLVQDVFVQLYRRRREVVDPVAWLRRATVNRCTSWVRRRMVERKHAGAAATPDGQLSPDAIAVRAGLAKLRPRHRAAVFMRYYLDLSEVDIAEALGCRPGTVKSLLHRGLRAMKEQLQ